jgi:hypothetical protein
LGTGRLAVAALSAALLLATSAEARSPPVHVGVVLKGLDNPFFVAMYEGARAEVGRRHVVATFRAAADVDDAKGQAARARALVQGGKHDCYVLNPIGGDNLVPASEPTMPQPVSSLQRRCCRCSADTVRSRWWVDTRWAARRPLDERHSGATSKCRTRAGWFW